MKNTSFFDNSQQISSWTIVHNKVQFLSSLKGPSQLNNKRMIDRGKDLSFGHCIPQYVLPHDCSFVQHFDSVSFSLMSILTEIDLSKGSSTEQ